MNALELADALDRLIRASDLWRTGTTGQAAAELRRLHGEIESMRAERISNEKELRRRHEVNQELVKALEAYLPFIPITSAKEGGASAFSENVRAADMFRAALAKATGGQA